jgi:type I restriction enzyme S subunit
MGTKYKNSGVDWIEMIPNDWRVEKGKHFFTQRNTKGNESPVLLAATQKSGMIPQSLLEGVVQVKLDTDLQTFKTVHIGDFVISLRSFQGGFEMSDYEGVCSPAYQVFYNTQSIFHKYYKYLFKSYGFISKMNSLVVGIREGKNIQYKDFAESLLPIPPLPTQQRIADFLDRKCAEIDELAALQETMIAELKSYKQSVITETVTKGLDPNVPLKDSGVEWIGEIPEKWEVIPLRYACEFRNGYTPSKDHPEYWTNGTIPWYRMEDIRLKGRKLMGAEQYITQEAIKGGGLFEAGSFILATTATIGEHAFLIADSLANQRFTNLKIRESLTRKLTTDFFFYYLFVVDDYCKDITNTSTFQAVSMEKLKKFITLVPSLSEQRAIADYLDRKCAEIDELIAIKQQKIEALKEYKKSVIFEYVTGKKEVL